MKGTQNTGSAIRKLIVHFIDAVVALTFYLRRT